MEIIVEPRQHGKTTEILSIAAEKYLYIVCFNQQEVDRVWRLALEQKLDIPQPITWNDFIDRRYYALGVKGFVIDNLDLCLKNYCDVPIEAVSLTEEIL